jgi:hypothetical protein
LEFAVAAFQPFARGVFFFQEGEAAAVGAETGVTLDEFVFAHADVSGDGGDFVGFHFHDAGPAAAVRAALADVMGGERFGHAPWIPAKKAGVNAIVAVLDGRGIQLENARLIPPNQIIP